MLKKGLCIALMMAMTGCSTLSGIKTGKEDTIKEVYDIDGKVVSRTKTTSDRPLFDTQFDYQKTVRHVADAASKSDASRASAIKDITVDGMRTASTQSESVLIGVIGVQSIERMGSSISGALSALGKRPKTLSEIGLQYVEAITKVAWTIPLSVAVHEQGKSAREYAKNGGNHTTVTGDGNTVSTKEVKTNSTINAGTTGDDSPVNVNHQQQATGCATGDCGKNKADGEKIPPDVYICTVDTDCADNDNGSICVEHVCQEPALPLCDGERGSIPGDHYDDDGILWVSPTCSCKSYQAYHCDV